MSPRPFEVPVTFNRSMTRFFAEHRNQVYRQWRRVNGLPFEPVTGNGLFEFPPDDSPKRVLDADKTITS